MIRSQLLLGVAIVLLSAAHAADPYTVEGLVGGSWELIKDGDDNPEDQAVTQFGQVTNGSTVIRQFRLTNLTENPIQVESVKFEGSSAFSTSFVGPVTVNKGAATAFTISLDAELGQEVAEVAITTSAPGEFKLFTFLLIGEGIPRTLYVDSTATGANNGSSWSNAFVELQDALAIALAGELILVAAGVYYPDQGIGQSNNARESTFSIPDGVTLRGAFPPGGGARNLGMHTTVLSGDLQKNDVDLDGNSIAESFNHISGSNAFSVVTIEGEAVLSGFTITAGDADEADAGPEQASGAGVYASGTVANRVELNMDHCRLVGCSSLAQADGGGGSAIRLSNGDLHLNQSTLENNFAGRSGGICRVGGPFDSNGSVTILHCNFRANETMATSPSTSTRTVLSIESDEGDCLISDTTFSGHRDSDQTDGLYHFSDLDLVEFVRCQWRDNECKDLLTFSQCSQVTLESSLLAGNDVNELILINGDVSLSLLNTTIAANRAFNVFRKIASTTNGTISIGNSVIDEPLGSGLGPEVTVFRSHSLVERFSADGNGNLDDNTDPGFVDPQSAFSSPTELGDYRLLGDSPLIDAGLNASNFATLDLDGKSRTTDGDDDGTTTIDIGAYEFPMAVTITINDVRLNPSGEFRINFHLDGAATINVQASPDLSPGSWNTIDAFSLPSAGDTEIGIDPSLFGGPADEMYFRLLSTP